LTKANSIEGCKKKGVKIIYTWASNLLKKDDMATGAVSFKDDKKVVSLDIEKNNDIVKKLNKTKSERNPDFKSNLLISA
jgi:uncharacterized protein YbcV (DUF1398 family)